MYFIRLMYISVKIYVNFEVNSNAFEDVRRLKTR